MTNYGLRIRAKLGLWLIRPFLIAQRKRVNGYIKAGHIPMVYHKDWWWGQYFGIESLWDSLRHGTLAIPYEERYDK